MRSRPIHRQCRCPLRPRCRAKDLPHDVLAQGCADQAKEEEEGTIKRVQQAEDQKPHKLLLVAFQEEALDVDVAKLFSKKNVTNWSLRRWSRPAFEQLFCQRRFTRAHWMMRWRGGGSPSSNASPGATCEVYDKHNMPDEGVERRLGSLL